MLFLTSLIALYRGNYRLHGRINIVFFVLTAIALVGLEVVVRIIDPHLFDDFDTVSHLKRALTIHLCFSLPSAAIMPFMLWTGLTHLRAIHLTLEVVFAIFWTCPFITGILFLSSPS